METKVLPGSPSSHIPTFKQFLSERRDSRLVPSAVASPELSWPSLYSGQPLPNKDAYLGQYIHRIYCRECREQEIMAASQQNAAAASANRAGTNPDSPPQYQMDQMSLAANMDENKEALSRKLMVRRSVPELIEQGIYPSLKSPAAFAVERLHLQRAQTSDKLKHKIQSRPDRQFLVQNHILEDSSIDPSLQSKQRQLKKAKLTDELNEKIANRPGPLELVEQHILEVDEPIKHAIEEGTLEFTKTQEGYQSLFIAKVPYEIDSPKSGTSSPEPNDCDTDSNASSAASTGFSHVPSPPDITPLLKQTHHITIGGQTVPVTSQMLVSPTIAASIVASASTQPPIFSSAPQHTVTSQHNRLISVGSSRSNRKQSKSSRPKQQSKQRIIKFHEYKGPSNSKSSCSTSSGGSFITTTGPLQKLDSLTPYQVRVQQQQLYLQCQLEVQNKGAMPTVLVPIQAPVAASMLKKDYPEISSPRQVDLSRPVTPALKSPPPSVLSAPQTPVHISRSLSNLEDLKVADLKQELKQRNLPVSGPKPQLIERLRNHQLQEMSVNGQSVSNLSDLGSYSNLPSVQSFSDESIMASPSVASTCGGGRVISPPTSPSDEFTRPQSTARYQDMETDESSSSAKSAADIVREQAKKIEELQRALQQSQQQLQLVQQPFVVGTAVPKSAESVDSKAMISHPIQAQAPTVVQTHPVDITNKPVFLASPDGTMTAYNFLIQSNGLVTNVAPSPAISNKIESTQIPVSMSGSHSGVIPLSAVNEQQVEKVGEQQNNSLQERFVIPGNNDANLNVDDVIEALIRTEGLRSQPSSTAAESRNTAPVVMNTQSVSSHSSSYQTTYSTAQSHPLLATDTNHTSNLEELSLDEQLSPLADMDWIEDESNTDYLNDLDPGSSTIDGHDAVFSDPDNLDWLSDMMQIESTQSNHIPTTQSLSFNGTSNADPILAPKTHDVLNIFSMDECELRSSGHLTQAINGSWDRPLGQPSHGL